MGVVNDCERLKTKDARTDTFGFNVGQRAESHNEIIVLELLRDFHAGSFHLAHSKATLLSQHAQLLTRG